MITVDRNPTFHLAWNRDTTKIPSCHQAIRPSVFLPLGSLGNENQRDSFIEQFNTLYLEHIEGFKKVKKEKGEKERNMEWRVRLKRKTESSGVSGGKNKTKEAEDRDRLKAIKAYQALKAEQRAGRGGGGGGGGRTTTTSSSSSLQNKRFKTDEARSQVSSSSSSSSSSSQPAAARPSSSGNSSGGGKKRPMSKAERKEFLKKRIKAGRASQKK